MRRQRFRHIPGPRKWETNWGEHEARTVEEVCKGCSSVNEDGSCPRYLHSDIWARMGSCPFNRQLKVETQVKVNPLKASRRKRRGN